MKSLYKISKSFKHFIFSITIIFLVIVMYSCENDEKEFLTPKESSWLKKNHTKIDVLFGYSAPPNAFYNEKGKYEGLLVDYYKEIENELGVKFNFKEFDNWSSVVEYAKVSENVIIVGIAETEDRKEYLKFTNSIVEIPYVILTKKGSEIKNMDDLLGKKVCVTEKYAIIDYLDEFYPDINPYGVPNDVEGVRAVSSSEYQAMVVSQMYGTYIVEEQGITNLKIAGESGYLNILRVAVSNKNPQLFKIISKTVNQIKPERRKELYNKWVSANSAKISQKTLNLINAIIGSILLVVILLWLWLVNLRKQVSVQTKQIQESEAKYRALIENSHEAFFLIYNQKFELVNQKFEDLFGYSENELIRKNIKVLDLVGNNNKQRVSEIIGFNNNKSLEPFMYEFEGITKTKEKLYLEAYVSYLKYKNEYAIQGVIHNITEQKNKEIELLEAKEKAEESDRLKSAFLANMSHEIRTPMNGILGFTELLDNTNLPEEKRKRFVNIIKQSGTRMLDTVNDLIDISKIETNQVKIFLSEININQRIDSLFNFFNQEAEQKGIKLSVKKELVNKLAIVTTDKSKLDSILTNLIKNAIKFTRKGSVKFGYELINIENQNYLKFYVNDTGIGIPKDRQRAIFNRFEQADIEDQEAHQGSGLGLTIAKSYVQMLGGKIWFNSIQNKGTQFYFTLPYEMNVTEIYNKEIEISKKEGMKQTETINILIVEDDQISSLYLSELLSGLQANIKQVVNGEQAVEYCKTHTNIDLVLMDIKMQGIGGYEATRQIRTFNKDIIIIAQTAYTLTGDREKALEAGCNDYIEKPINKTLLLKKIELYIIKKIVL